MHHLSKVAETANEEEVKKMCMYKYPGMKKKMGEFELAIVAGEFTDSEIMVMLGKTVQVKPHLSECLLEGLSQTKEEKYQF